MLRRKLLIILGSLVALLVAVAVAAIWLLQTVLQDLEHINDDAAVAVRQVDRLAGAITATEVELYQIQLRRERHLDTLIDTMDTLEDAATRLGRHYATREAAAASLHAAIVARLPQFKQLVGAMATTRDPELAGEQAQAALGQSIALRRDALELGTHIRQHAQAEQEALSRRFRWLVLGLALAFLLVINLSALVLLRMASMILRPVDKLVEASRRLAVEQFDHRVVLDQHDEFDELARAYNHLAAQLQANEARKVEVLQQVALALNHELNNAMAIIELQLELLSRKDSGNPTAERHLRQIRENLSRMGSTIERLKQVRRIVLTDYVSGVKMLDLEESVRQSEAEARG